MDFEVGDQRQVVGRLPSKRCVTDEGRLQRDAASKVDRIEAAKRTQRGKGS